MKQIMRTLAPVILIVLALGLMVFLSTGLAAAPPTSPTPDDLQPLSVLAPMGLGEWTKQSSHTSANLHAVQFLDDQTGFAAGEAGVLLRTEDGGENWEKRLTGADATIRAIHFFDARRGWIAGDKGLLMYTDDGGINWRTEQLLFPGDFHALSFTSTNDGWVAGEDGALYRYVGGEWLPVKIPTDLTLYALAFIDARTGWAAGEDGIILRTEDGGQNWRIQTLGGADAFYSLALADGDYGWAAGADGVILHTTDAGLHWRLQASNTSRSLYGVAMADRFTGWVAGAGGLALYTGDGGVTWLQDNPGVGFDLRAAAAPEPRRAWLVGDAGTIVRWQDPRPTATPTPTPTDTPTPSPTPTPTDTPAPTPTSGEITLFVYFDQDRSADFTTGDTPISDMTITLKDDQGVIRGVETTDADGLVMFYNLSPGRYTMTAMTLPLGYYPTTDYPVISTLVAGEQQHLQLGFASDRTYIYLPMVQREQTP